MIFHSYVSSPEGTVRELENGPVEIVDLHDLAIKKMVDLSIYSGWWCNVPILKNGGVKVHGFRMTSLFYEMEHKIPWFETTKQYFKSQVGHFAGYLWRSQDGSAISSHL